jgi:hypothetical protein
VQESKAFAPFFFSCNVSNFLYNMGMIKEPPFPIGFKKPIVNLPAEKMRNRFGRMVYGHKTAGAIEITTKACWDSNKKYFEPNGARSCVKNFSKST